MLVDSVPRSGLSSAMSDMTLCELRTAEVDGEARLQVLTTTEHASRLGVCTEGLIIILKGKHATMRAHVNDA